MLDQCNASNFAYWPSKNAEFTWRTSNQRYITFEPDHNGWNNHRMAFENAVALAYALNRTLVLPPKHHIHHLRGSDHSVDEWFQMSALKSQIEVISIDDLLQETPIFAQVLPPGSVTEHVRGVKATGNITELVKYLRAVGYFPGWRWPTHCLLIEDAAPGCHGMNASELSVQEESFCNGRAPIRASSAAFANQPLLHFPYELVGKDEREWKRLSAGHFYTFLRFRKPHQQATFLRFMRDNVRYQDTIVCAAAAVVRALRKEAGGSFSTLHIRRGNFGLPGTPSDERCAQRDAARETTKERRAFAERLAHAVASVLHTNEMLYIATDEVRPNFFKPLVARGFRLRFQRHVREVLLPYAGALGGKHAWHFHGAVEQLVAAQGRTFHGTLRSTFSGYVVRLRGYLNGSTAALHTRWLPCLRQSAAFVEEGWPSPPFWGAEWPLAWRISENDIDLSRQLLGEGQRKTGRRVSQVIKAEVAQRNCGRNCITLDCVNSCSKDENVA
mmetsp:Transcript_33259/g.54941  ORF Transcript_33259/g.54941 Transcript_33259/m.54941 type:complete len:500 (+) Transcript_33259:183-1682(+)